MERGLKKNDRRLGRKWKKKGKGMEGCRENGGCKEDGGKMKVGWKEDERDGREVRRMGGR